MTLTTIGNLLINFGEVAVHDVAVGVAQVHAVALAVTPERAVGTQRNNRIHGPRNRP